MKKFLFSLVLCILVVSGCSSNIDISEYMDIYFIEPTITEDLEVSDLRVDVAFNTEKFVEDHPDFDASLLSEDLLESLEFTVDGESLENYNFTQDDFEIEIANPDILKNTGLNYRKRLKFDQDSDENQKMITDAKQEIEDLNYKIEDINRLQKYAKAANELYDLYQGYNIELYVSEAVFGDVYDYLDLKPKIYQPQIDEIANYNQSNSYFITEKTNDTIVNQSIGPEIYTSFIDKDFYVTAEFIQGGMSLRRSYSIKNDSSSKVYDSYSAIIPVVYQKGKDGTYLTYNGKTYKGNEMLSSLLTQVKKEYEVDDELNGSFFHEEQNYEYNKVYSDGMEFKGEVKGNASSITIETMMEAQITNDNMSSSYMVYTGLVYNIMVNNYNIDVKKANGEFS